MHIPLNIDVLNRCAKASKQYPEHSIDILSSLSSSQLISKRTIVEDIERNPTPQTITILASWFAIGFGSQFVQQHTVTCVDINPTCKLIGQYIFPQYGFVTNDVSKFAPKSNIVINTSIEHIDQHTLTQSLDRILPGTICYFQSNNMSWMDDHDYCSPSMEHLIQRLGPNFNVVWAQDIPIQKKMFEGKRFTVKGIKI